MRHLLYNVKKLHNSNFSAMASFSTNDSVWTAVSYFSSFTAWTSKILLVHLMITSVTQHYLQSPNPTINLKRTKFSERFSLENWETANYPTLHRNRAPSSDTGRFDEMSVEHIEECFRTLLLHSFHNHQSKKNPSNTPSLCYVPPTNTVHPPRRIAQTRRLSRLC